MNAPALIIQGSLVDAKNVAAHKCVRLSIDVPAELGAQIVKTFGWPTMAEPVSVAVARLNAEAVEGQKEKKRFTELQPSAQAVLLCKKEAFWRFLAEEGKIPIEDEAQAAERVRFICRVESRSALNTDEEAKADWEQLRGQYNAWMDAP